MMEQNQVVGIIQARMSSKRLPGKVLKMIQGQPMLARVVERARMAETLDKVVVATTNDPSDDPVAELCQERGYPFLRGNLYDVLDRFYKPAQTFGADVVVRFTGDCPLLDPGLVDHTVREFFRTGVDFAANRLPPPHHRTYPIGLDTEVCTFEALECAWRYAEKPYQREHVMPYLYEEEERFKVLHVQHEEDYGSLRWTVDTPEDLEVVRKMYSALGDREDFSWLDVLDVFRAHPEWAEINARVQHKSFVDIENGR
jgi:spore coat polysaccharide biosynthesis protein SpsF